MYSNLPFRILKVVWLDTKITKHTVTPLSTRTHLPIQVNLSHLRIMNERAERINGWAAMIGVMAAIGSYATTGQIIPGVW